MHIGIARCCGSSVGARRFLVLMLLLVAVVAAAEARALERLSPDQLDAVTAGQVVATASAQAHATGPNARTTTSTRTAARQNRLLSVTLRGVSNRLVLAERVNERAVEVAFASASASASGSDPRVECNASVAFSGQPSSYLIESQRVVQSSFANCLCATFGVLALPN